ncbi:Uncharacterized protein PECH_001248 [Penicillium ucsense]|uniref:DUF7730 domain-containing protein n=1 Tax=Penicillium ucsense TaxID=2839758 RepID=A0A8J8WHU2_9EURO|nr:Uncharacterized protein PECM_001021 [Penicillium ucsense]KAF7733040.1 Uncharacterized protein PECH_001248 [Penicillium ucsense]
MSSYKSDFRPLKEDDLSTEKLPDLEPSLPENDQDACPLFTKLPPETRNRIYALSLEYSGVRPWSDTREPARRDPGGVDINEDETTGTNAPYRGNAFYFRPGYNQPRRILIALLRTCQRIYREASLLPAEVSEHTFWFYRGPPHVKNGFSPRDYFSKMSPKQQSQVQRLHFFTQQFFLEDAWSNIWNGIEIVREKKKESVEGVTTNEIDTRPSHNGIIPFSSYLASRQLSTSGLTLSTAIPKAQRTQLIKISPRTLTITIRHTDWWFWEDNHPLALNPFHEGATISQHQARLYPRPDPSRAAFPSQRAWGNQFVTMPSLEELTFEFETVMRKRDQLDNIIQRALHWEFPLRFRPGTKELIYLVADPASLRAYTWVGATENDLKAGDNQQSALVPQFAGVISGNEVSAAAWMDRSVPETPVLRPYENGEGPRTGVPSGMEEYYVVFLTWKVESGNEE